MIVVNQFVVDPEANSVVASQLNRGRGILLARDEAEPVAHDLVLAGERPDEINDPIS